MDELDPKQPLASPEAVAWMRAQAQEARERGDETEAEHLEAAAAGCERPIEELRAEIAAEGRELRRQAYELATRQIEAERGEAIPPEIRKQLEERREAAEEKRVEEHWRRYDSDVSYRREVAARPNGMRAILREALGVPVASVARQPRSRERRPGVPRARRSRASRGSTSRGDPDSDEPPGGRLHHGRRRRRYWRRRQP